MRRVVCAGRRLIRVSANSYAGARAIVARWLPLTAVLLLLTACFTLTVDPRALELQPDGSLRALTLTCPPSAAAFRDGRGASPLDPESIRLATWNIHKEGDAGWQQDLARIGGAHDVLLLQEATLQPALREILRDAELHWVMASSFGYGGYDTGVITASRATPVASCTQRAVEPLLGLPKSAAIAWFALKGDSRTLAVVNVHAINFSLSIEDYRAQFTALGDALAAHDGPIIFAGDLNTWSTARNRVVDDVAAKLGLTAVSFPDDKRSLFFGNQLDHILIRGLRVVGATAIEVTSSDHNPVTATLQMADQ